MEDFLPAIAWFVITFVAATVAFRCATSLRGEGSTALRLIDSVILCWLWLTISVVSMSAAGLFGFYWFSAGVLILGAGSWAFLVNARSLKGKATCVRNGEGKRVRSSPGDSAGPLNIVVSNSTSLLWVVCASLASTLIIVRGVLRFPNDWDTLMYHRPLYVQWIQDKNLLASGDAVWYNPSGNELWGLWLAAPFSGDFWVGLMSVPSFMLLCCGVSHLLKLLRIDHILSVGLTACILGTTVPIRQVYCGKNDLAVAGLAIVALAYALRFGRGNRRADSVFCAISIGLLAGVKYYALGYAAVVFTTLTVISLLAHGWRKALSTAMMAALISIGTGGFWYARNLSQTGTPFYPAGYRAESGEELKQRRDVWKSSLLGNGHPEVVSQYFDAIRDWGGIAQAFCLVLVPATTIVLGVHGIRCMRKPSMKSSGAESTAMALAIAGAWLVFSVTPYTVSPGSEFSLHRPYLLARFSLFPLTLSLIAVTTLIRRSIDASLLSVLARRCAKALMGICLLYCGWTTLTLGLWRALRKFPWDGVYCFFCCLFLLLACLMVANQKTRLWGMLAQKRRLQLSLVSLAFICLTFAAISVRQSNWWHSSFYAYFTSKFKTSAYTDLATLPVGTRIAAVDHRYYPLFGSRREYVVFRPSHLRSHESFQKYLQEYGIEVVADALGKASPMTGYPKATSWLRENDDWYVPARPGAPYGLYRVEPLKIKR